MSEFEHTCPVTGADCLTCEDQTCQLMNLPPLPDRLREHVQQMACHGFVGGAGAWNRVSNDMLTAADELERLRADNDRLRAFLKEEIRVATKVKAELLADPETSNYRLGFQSGYIAAILDASDFIKETAQ